MLSVALSNPAWAMRRSSISQVTLGTASTALSPCLVRSKRVPRSPTSAVTALLAIPIGYPEPRAASGEAAKLNNFDAELLKQGKVAKALAELQRASSLDPTDVFTSRHSGLSDELTAQMDEAFATDRRALALKPHEPVKLSNPTVLRDKAGRYDEVLAIFEQAASIDPLSRTIQQDLENARRNREIVRNRWRFVEWLGPLEHRHSI